MFCKFCGKELPDEAGFCPSCGKKISEDNAAEHDSGTEGQPSSESKMRDAASNVAEKANAVSDKIEKMNPLCIAGLVLSIIMFFFNYYGIVCYTAFIISLFGFLSAKKNHQRGTMLAIVCMAVSGVVGLIAIIKIIEYVRYESATYGAMDGVFSWLGDLFY